MMNRHEVVKTRREPVRRSLTVTGKRLLTPRMLRIEFHSDELQGFESPSPDDHIKIFLPAVGEAAPAARDFTPRAWDVAAGTFALEFALHARGPASDWARAAQVGDALTIGGPKGSSVVPDDFDWYVLLGDACALPSFARRLEGLRAGVPVLARLLVPGDAEQQPLHSAARLEAQWLLDTEDSVRNAEAVRATLPKLPNGDGYVWIAGETTFAREMYAHVVGTLHHPPEWVKSAAYWTATPAE